MVSTPKPLFSTLLRQLHLEIRREIYDAVCAAGYDDIGANHLYVFQLPGPDGLRPTELAERMNMTKQASNHLLASLEELGYITREAVAHDGRARLVRSTAKGRAVATVMQRTSREIEHRWSRALGQQHLEHLRAELSTLAELASDAVSGTAQP
jgi:DNA-binding MarR family transcriptional regulator